MKVNHLPYPTFRYYFSPLCKTEIDIWNVILQTSSCTMTLQACIFFLSIFLSGNLKIPLPVREPLMVLPR